MSTADTMEDEQEVEYAYRVLFTEKNADGRATDIFEVESVGSWGAIGFINKQLAPLLDCYKDVNLEIVVTAHPEKE